ncbi:hypothetical protein A3F27_01405 [Candidatus Kaiserbacteria bacterium RIFCSPHIGHO2_12_FULL_53_13]|uniref:Helix-turn-helix domain-containing protein n=1 Tax=Candidatus Kaiserbacteria bacterium RIFCSPHIGHO2_12_FULL_53_13 TaxID=1798502 RepID=A0A1F6E6P6_9BACT|nr:MAG: hypothetical protein A3F27_01405 [Candidatus Kaiserbacteria bacterium RIFCSPHIGHO2_12_FULL_53_13]OGG74209.1 MAG: hypothetical protein A3A37_00420 [Candidatus Kaiserbacteria bacterium RIFCSPLOWO2_01_FULL_52_36]
MNKNPEKSHFSTSEIAKLMGVSRTAVFKKIKEGKIKAEKVGRNYIIRKKELEAILGMFITPAKKEEINNIVKRAVKEYHVTFRRLGRE